MTERLLATVQQNLASLAIIRDPPEFLMGSPTSEPSREGGADGPTEMRRRIGRTFAIATKEITVEQFQRFQAGHYVDKNAASSPAYPVHFVSWYHVVAYCNSLSKQEGIPEDQWCYLPNSEFDGNVSRSLEARGWTNTNA